MKIHEMLENVRKCWCVEKNWHIAFEKEASKRKKFLRNPLKVERKEKEASLFFRS